MKINKNFSFKIEDADFVFKRPSMVEIWKSQKENQDNFQATKSILNDLIMVQGLQSEDGESITVDQIKSLDVPADFINRLIACWSQAIKSLTDGKSAEASQEKKE